MKRNYFARLIDTKDHASSKRFLALAMSSHLIITSFFVLFSSKPVANTQLLADSMLFDMIIVLMAIFGMSVEGAISVLTARFNAMSRRRNMFGYDDEDYDFSDRNYGIHQTIIGGNLTPDTPENP